MYDFKRNIKKNASKNIKKVQTWAHLKGRKLSNSILSLYEDSSTSNSEQEKKTESESCENETRLEAPRLTSRAQTHADLSRLNDHQPYEAQEYALGLSLNNLNQISNYSSTMITRSPVKKNQCYDISGTKDLIIINVLKYKNGKPRTGSEKDVERLENAFESRDFNIAKKITTGEVLYDQVKEALKSYVKSDARPSLFAIAIMAHGDEEDRVLFSDGRLESVNKILEPIFKSPKFLGIPKLIICQFCRGNSQIYACQVDKNNTLDSVDSKNDKFINALSDTVYYFATAKGNPAMRSKNDGSPFITSFCKVFQTESEFMEMSYEIHTEVAAKEFWINGEIYRIVPFLSQSLRKKIVFPERQPGN